MASVWKRLQRVNKRAAKFQYTATYHRIDLETSAKWKPNKLSIVWTRRSRRVLTEPQDWEPSLKDPLKGSVIYPLPENHTVAVTLFKDSRTNDLEDKDWTFVLEDVSTSGKRRRLAACPINMRKFASLSPAQHSLVLRLTPSTQKIFSASIHLTLHSVLLREGQATDEDMQSLASLLSVNNNSDIAVLEDLDEDDYTLSDQSTKQMHDLRQQMEEMTQSLTNSDLAATPNSVQSLNFDNSRTPTAPVTPLTPLYPLNPEPSTPVNEKPTFSFTPVDKLEQKFTFKPKTVAKRNLRPLELKLNLNNINLNGNDNEVGEDKTPTAGDKTPTAGDKTPTASDKLLVNERDKTPVQDLLEWCQSICLEYKQCRIVDLTSSFRSGLALCAIIHYYRPDLVDFGGLQPDNAEHNVRTALDASATLGIPQVLSVHDVVQSDRLAIMTYLFQLRAYFTGNELQVEQLGNDETESSYLVGRHDTDGAMPRDLFSREISTRRSKVMQRPTDSVVSPQVVARPPTESPVRAGAESPVRVGAGPLKASLVAQSRSLLGKLAKPSAKWFNDPLPRDESPAGRPGILMTRKELTDPFASDDEEDPPHNCQAKPEQSPSLELCITEAHPEQVSQPLANQAELIKPPTPEHKPTPQLLSRHDELKERARQLLEATKREAREKDRDKRQSSKEREEESKDHVVNGVNDDSPKKAMTEEERQAMLRERARKLIADARAGIVSPTSPLSPTRSTRGAIEIITKQSVLDELAAAGGGVPRSDSEHSSSRESSTSPTERSDDAVSLGGRSLHSFSALVERLSPDKEDGDETQESGSYIQSELEALEREQKAIDERAAALEVLLRTVMQADDNNQKKRQRLSFLLCMDVPHDPEEDKLMSQWFNLVNKKNALLRRQMQLNILEQEEDLSRRCELLARELRLSLGVDEWRKTSEQKRRERLLLQELLSAVNKRDTLVQQMDEQEKRIADDDEIQRNLSQVEIQRKNNCILQ